MALKYWQDTVYPYWFWVSGPLRELQLKMQVNWVFYYADRDPQHFLIGGFEPGQDDVAVNPHPWVHNVRPNWLQTMRGRGQMQWQPQVNWAIPAGGLIMQQPAKLKEPKPADPNAALPVIIRLSGATAKMIKEICGIKE